MDESIMVYESVGVLRLAMPDRVVFVSPSSDYCVIKEKKKYSVFVRQQEYGKQYENASPALLFRVDATFRISPEVNDLVNTIVSEESAAKVYIKIGVTDEGDKDKVNVAPTPLCTIIGVQYPVLP